MERALRRARRRRRTPRRRRRRPQLRRRRRSRPRSGRPAATIPLAPKIPSFGSAMCIEPPRPRLVPWSLPISSANIPSGSRPLARQWPWPRWVEVMTSAGAQRPARARRPPPPARSRGGRSRGPRRRGRAQPPAVRSRGSAASAGASRRGQPSGTRSDEDRPAATKRVVYWSVQSGRAMTDQIEIPESFPGPGAVNGKRVVITGASRGLGALLAHAFSQSGASVALVARTEKDLKAVAEALPGPSLVLSGDVTDEDFNEAVADATVAEWGGVDVWICNAGISPDRGRPPPDRRLGLAAGPGGEPHGRVPRGPRRGPGDARGRPADLHGLGPGRAAAPGTRPRTAPRRPGWSAWPRAWRSIWPPPASR